MMMAMAAFASISMASVHPYEPRDASPQERPVLNPSTDGLCGVSNGFTCTGSGFAPCCRYVLLSETPVMPFDDVDAQPQQLRVLRLQSFRV